MFLEYIANMYVLSMLATIIGLCILYMYDKFEKKQYTNAIYMRIGILIFMSCLGTIYISRMNFFQNNTSLCYSPSVLLCIRCGVWPTAPSTTNL